MNEQIRPLKKARVLARLEALRGVVEDEELQKIHALTTIDILLDYLHDVQIREAVDSIPM